MPKASDVSARESAPSLREPLPTDVVAHSAGLLGWYRNYPVYGVSWFWRRTAILAPIASAIGLAQVLVSAAVLKDWSLTPKAAAFAVSVWIALVTAGPALAAFVRHRRWPLQRERIGIIAAIAIAMVVSFTLQHVSNVYSHAIYQSYRDPSLPQPPPPDTVVVLFAIALQAVVFFSLSGGWALPAYFKEQRRWREAQHARELAALSQQKNEADLKLTVLQAQVEPHFLFNTLASVHSLVRQDQRRAEITIEALVDHLRATMPKLRAGLGSAHSTLADQLEICESYLAVMQVRMAPRLQYAIEVPAALRLHPFPSFMLISLVDNAIKHGIEPSPSPGSIVISAELESSDGVRRLAVRVVDDGVGLKHGCGTGVGLENIRAQLAALFGSEAGLTVRARSPAGAEATIRVPYVESSA